MRHAVVFLLGCAHPAPLGTLPDPHAASAFSCTHTEPADDSRCFVDRPSCDRYVSERQAAGVHAATCAEQSSASCFVGQADDRAWICAQDQPTCDSIRGDAMKVHEVGACVARVVNAK